jgi:hypothetical protein
MSAMPVLSNTHLLLFVAGVLAGSAICLLVLAAQDLITGFREIRHLISHKH